MAHHLTGGLGTYWTDSNTILSSGGRVVVAPTKDDGKVPYTWVTKTSWYDSAGVRATFVIAMPGTTADAYSFPERGVENTWGKPAHEYRVGKYLIMVYNKNLLSQVSKPGPV